MRNFFEVTELSGEHHTDGLKMAITWTIIVLGALLHGMASADDDTSATSPQPTGSALTTIAQTALTVTTSAQNGPTVATSIPTGPTVTTSTQNDPTAATSAQNDPTAATSTQTGPTVATSTQNDPIAATSAQNDPSVTTSTQNDPIAATSAQNDPSVTTSTQNDPIAAISTQNDPIAATSTQNDPIAATSTQTGPTVTTSTQNDTSGAPPEKNDPSVTPTAQDGSLPTTGPASSSPQPSDSGKNTGPPTKLFSTEAPSSRSHQIVESRTTIVPSTSVLSTPTTRRFTHPSFDLSSSSEGNIVLETCKKLSQNMKGRCSVELTIYNKTLIATVKIDADQVILPESYEPPKKKEETSKVAIPDTLIAILASCGALVLILCCFAAYCTYHRRSYRKNQQHLTEELQTVENGYHDNPTLEVMEVQPEMQEKKMTLNGEFNDSWIVPIDNLLKDDIPDEEDTHL